MAKAIEFYKGKPVFFAANSKELARAVAAYVGDAQPPYVVRWSGKVSKVREKAFEDDEMLEIILHPDTVTKIADGAFSGCVNLTEVHFGESLQDIGENAFYGCVSLASLFIPASVVSIANGAFENCSSLASIKVSPDNPYWDSREDCDALETVYIKDPALLEKAGIIHHIEILTT